MALGVSQAARFQAYQTRARMSASLWFRIILAVLFAWFALTFCVVWLETGKQFPDINHQYFWRWAILSTLVRTPVLGTIILRCKVPANGTWYPVGPLVNWMNSP